jgi:hypothetical protein
VGKGTRRIECYVGQMALAELTKKARKCEDIGARIIPGSKYPALPEIDKKARLFSAFSAFPVFFFFLFFFLFSPFFE